MPEQEDKRMLTEEELDRILRSVDWNEIDPPESYEARKEETLRHLMERVRQMQVHWRHVRIWRNVCCSVAAVALVIGWFAGTAPLRIAIHATAQIPASVRLLQETQRGTSSADLAESPLRRKWNSAVALVTPGARSAVVTDARWDSATGLVRATIRGTNGYVLVDPGSKMLVGAVGMNIPGNTHAQKTSAPLFVQLELARQIAMTDPIVQKTGRRAVAVSSLTAYHIQSVNRASSSVTSSYRQRYTSAGTLVAVQLQRSRETDPDLTAIVNTVERRVVQIVNTDQIQGLVISDLTGAYAVIEPETH